MSCLACEVAHLFRFLNGTVAWDALPQRTTGSPVILLDSYKKALLCCTESNGWATACKSIVELRLAKRRYETMNLGRQASGWKNLNRVFLVSALTGATLAIFFEALIVAVALVGMHATGFPIAVLVELVLQEVMTSFG